MPPGGLDAFREVWLADFEFSAPPGERPTPVCLAARELRTGRTLRLWHDDLRGRRVAPYPTGPDVLFVAYYAAAELACHLALGWPLPAYVLDLYAEFRNATNGLSPPHGASLLGALAWHGLSPIDGAEKPSMRALASRGGPWTAGEREALLRYCESDAAALGRLLPRMLPEIDFPRALLRGRYVKAVARMEYSGVPIDTPTLARLRAGWESIKDSLIRAVDSRFGVFDGRAFRADRWAVWVDRSGIAWPRLDSGALDLSDDTFRQMARTHPEVALMRELRDSLSQLRLSALAVGSDGRNRTLLSPFRARTGRNQPSNSRFVFGPSCWLRGLVKPAPGRAVAYVDWEQQEFGIAAALSRDPAMMAAYRSGDPYLAFARQAGRVPPGATRRSHPAEREQFKQCTLGVQYGMGPGTLAARIDRPTPYARELLRLHREAFPRFWDWSDRAERLALLSGRLETAFGWTIRVGPDANPRMLRNFPCQANGAEMLRLACSMATERGLGLVAPIHDALVLEGPSEGFEESVAALEEVMANASEAVLEGFQLRTERVIVRWPGRYMDPRGREFWGRVMAFLPDPDGARPRAPDPCGIAGGGCAEMPGEPCGLATPV